MKLHIITLILVIVGALNWGLVGIGSLLGGTNLNLVNLLLGRWSMIEAIVYLLVGLSAVYEIAVHKKICRNCGSGMVGSSSAM
jgi:uncharacterized membrane protein YuzA (DUF378 family)